MNSNSKPFLNDYLRKDQEITKLVGDCAKVLFKGFIENLPKVFDKMIDQTDHSFSSKTKSKVYY